MCGALQQEIHKFWRQSAAALVTCDCSRGGVADILDLGIFFHGLTKSCVKFFVVVYMLARDFIYVSNQFSHGLTLNQELFFNVWIEKTKTL